MRYIFIAFGFRMSYRKRNGKSRRKNENNPDGIGAPLLVLFSRINATLLMHSKQAPYKENNKKRYTSICTSTISLFELERLSILTVAAVNSDSTRSRGRESLKTYCETSCPCLMSDWLKWSPWKWFTPDLIGSAPGSAMFSFALVSKLPSDGDFSRLMNSVSEISH